MNDFKTIFKESLLTLPHIKLNRITELDIQKCTLSILELKDMGKLRDRYEGQAFYDDKLLKINSYLSCLEYLKEKKPMITPDFVKNFKPIINFNDEIIVVVAFKLGTLPSLKTIENKKRRIFVIQKSPITYSICGIASLEILNNPSNYINHKNNGLEAEFIGFSQLEIEQSIK